MIPGTRRPIPRLRAACAALALALLPAPLAAQSADGQSTDGQSAAGKPADVPPAEAQLVLHRQIDISAMRGATVPYGQAGNWSVRIDQVGAFGCSIAAQYDNALGLRFQYNPAEATTLIFAGSTSWQSVKDGDRKDMSFSFEGRDTWSGAAIGTDADGMHWLTFKAKGTGIFDEMQAASWFALKIDTLELGIYETGEIARAVELLRQCQALANKAVEPAAARPPAQER